ncbi:hypothetical protein ENSA7_13130 [Enhygromyxa salina]|uniref:Uncharacterized protein n=1 Tax=Enhygromyxa salina TaxID=215803 RepID=A0A2S9YUZ9_9BACT|nr:hypothetical protein ENSA7_13130 [Enhygromyxa salina]
MMDLLPDVRKLKSKVVIGRSSPPRAPHLEVLVPPAELPELC